MKCIHCKGKMVRGTVPFHVDRKGYHLTFDTMPAWVCSQCGEPYFEKKEVDAIQDALHVLDEQTQKIAVGQ